MARMIQGLVKFLSVEVSGILDRRRGATGVPEDLGCGAYDRVREDLHANPLPLRDHCKPESID